MVRENTEKSHPVAAWITEGKWHGLRLDAIFYLLAITLSKEQFNPVTTWIKLNIYVGHFLWVITALIMFQRDARYLTLTDAAGSFSFLKQPCQKTRSVVVEEMELCFRGVKLLACIR